MPANRQSVAVTGNTQVAPANPAGRFGNISSPFQLVSWRASDGIGRQMIVTLGQVLKHGRPGPWLGPPGSGVYLAPNAGAPLVRIQWGAGGQRQQTFQAWPVCGASFAITCDSIDIDVVTSAQVAPGESLDYTAWVMPAEAPYRGELSSSGFVQTVGIGAAQNYQIRGSFVKSLRFEVDVDASATSNNVVVVQGTVDNTAAGLVNVVRQQQISGQLQSFGYAEVPLDPWCAIVQVKNLGADFLTLTITETSIFA